MSRSVAPDSHSNTTLRILKPNLLYIFGLRHESEGEALLKEMQNYGKVIRFSLNLNPDYLGEATRCHAAYVTFRSESDSVNVLRDYGTSKTFNGRKLKISVGTTKYCRHFLEKKKCPRAAKDCIFIHRWASPDRIISRDNLQRHQRSVAFEESLIKRHFGTSVEGSEGKHHVVARASSSCGRRAKRKRISKAPLRSASVSEKIYSAIIDLQQLPPTPLGSIIEASSVPQSISPISQDFENKSVSDRISNLSITSNETKSDFCGDSDQFSFFSRLSVEDHREETHGPHIHKERANPTFSRHHAKFEGTPCAIISPPSHHLHHPISRDTKEVLEDFLLFQLSHLRIGDVDAVLTILQSL